MKLIKYVGRGDDHSVHGGALTQPSQRQGRRSANLGNRITKGRLQVLGGICCNEIEAWHEKLGTSSASITVGDAETAAADFVFTAPSGG